jgi:aminomethyltransferase
MADSPSETLLETPLAAEHRALGARMVPFGGYAMPVQYPTGILAEHKWTREHAGLFDVSHMGPSFLTLSDRTGDAEKDHAAVAALIEPLVTGEIRGLKPGQVRYTLMTNEEGGVIDDLMVARSARLDHSGTLYVVVNAGTKDGDFALIAKSVGARARLERADEGGLLALQGPEAAEVMRGLVPEACELGSSFRAPAIPARTASRSSSTRITPWRSGAGSSTMRGSSRSASARATRCGLKPACR